MNLFAATLIDENAPIGTQYWYSTTVPLIQLHFPVGTDVSPAMTCKEFLQLVMALPTDIRSRVLNTEIPEPQEELEQMKRSGHKTMLVTIVAVLLFSSMLIVGGYVAMTASAGGSVDKEVMDGFFKFLWMLVKFLAAAAGVELGEEGA